MGRGKNKKERNRTAERAIANVTGYFPVNFVFFCHLPALRNLIGFHQVVARSQFGDCLPPAQSVPSSFNFLSFLSCLCCYLVELCLCEGQSIC